MFIPTPHVLLVLEQYRYLLLFPVAVLEGPIITIIAGFLSYLNFLNIYLAYVILVVGDLTGDVLHYVIGRYWRKSFWIKRYGHFLGYDENSERFIENHFDKHKIKTLIAAKFFHGVGTPIQITAGIARVNFREYFLVNFLATVPKTLVLLLVGFYMGDSYVKIDGYFDFMAFTTISIFILILLFIISHKLAKKYLTKVDDLE